MKRITFLAMSLAMIFSHQTSASTFSLGMCTTDPMVIAMNNSMLTMADNIGVMADRILVTETYIGDMANRIVDSENLMASMLVQLQENLTGSSGSGGSRPGVLVLAPVTGSTVSRQTPPTLSLSDSATSYVMYISTTGTFQDGSMLPILVTPETPLAAVWANAVQSLTGNTIYIAVKSVYGQSNLSELSNGVRLTLL